MTPDNIIIDFGAIANISLGHWFAIAFVWAAGTALGKTMELALRDAWQAIRRRR